MRGRDYACIEKIRRTLDQAGLDGEIVVCDNGSTDRSVAIAEAMGARVVQQPERGYGNAYLKGFDSARGRYLVMGDAVDTYDFTMIQRSSRRCGRTATPSSPAAGTSAAATATSRPCTAGSATRRSPASSMRSSARATPTSTAASGHSPGGLRADPAGEPGHGVQPRTGDQRRPAGLKTTEIPIVLAPRKGVQARPSGTAGAACG